MTRLCEIIASEAWRDDDNVNDDDGGWRQGNYWIDGRSYTYDSCSSGDHETIRAKDIPTDKEIAQSWLDYAQWVAEHGMDPLHNYYASQTRTMKQRWQFRFSPMIGGIALTSARRRGKAVDARDLPVPIVEFLNLDQQRRRVKAFDNRKEAEDCGVPMYKWHTETVEVKIPNPNYVREIRQLARRHLQRSKAAA